MHFVVPVPSLHAGPNPKYFVPRHGVTWLNVVSDRVMGLGGLVVPGTLRDSMVILDAIFNLDVATAPELVPRQATFARNEMTRSASLSLWRLRQAM
jgi:TnpA family transposase